MAKELKTKGLPNLSGSEDAWEEHYCSLDLPTLQEQDVLNIKRTIDYPSGISEISQQRVPRELIVEMDIHLRFIRTTEGLVLGDPIYTTTLLPGESVQLYSSDRRTSFTFDSESNLSYKSVQISETQHYMSALRHFSADGEAEQGGKSSSDYNSGWDFHGDAEGSLGFMSASASTNARGSFNSHSVGEYLNSQRYHAESAESNSVEATNKANTMSMGEVNNRARQSGTTQDHFESSSRTFKNANKSHAVTYLFYRINKKQVTVFELVGIDFRIKDPNSMTHISHLPIATAPLRFKPTALPVNSKFFSEQTTPSVLKSFNIRVQNAAAAPPSLNAEERLQLLNVIRPYFGVDKRKEAIEKVKRELVREGLLEENFTPSAKLVNKVSFKKVSALPTGGIVVKGYLDECDTAEPLMKERYQLENDKMRLENALLQKQIDLLDQSQEYRCCPPPQP
jgi:hypothetical protein